MNRRKFIQQLATTIAALPLVRWVKAKSDLITLPVNQLQGQAEIKIWSHAMTSEEIAWRYQHDDWSGSDEGTRSFWMPAPYEHLTISFSGFSPSLEYQAGDVIPMTHNFYQAETSGTYRILHVGPDEMTVSRVG